MGRIFSGVIGGGMELCISTKSSDDQRRLEFDEPSSPAWRRYVQLNAHMIDLCSDCGG